MPSLSKYKPLVLPIAMVGGVVFHNHVHYVGWIAPYLIFVMLTVAFTKVRLSDLKLTRLSWLLLAVQLVGAAGVYLALQPFNQTLAIGTAICILCPTATAAPVITGMLGGSIMTLVCFSILSNVAVAILAPILFTLTGDCGEISIVDTALRIMTKVAPVILGPLLLAWFLSKYAPRVHGYIARHQSLSFYIWALSLLIVVGKAMSYVIAHHEQPGLMIALCVGALAVCLLQFGIGRRIGGHYGDKVSGAQGLGQKNTVLAIWMAFEFFGEHEVASVAPAAYVAWQNGINSLQLYLKSRRAEHK